MQLKTNNNAIFILVTALMLAVTSLSMQLINFVSFVESFKFYTAIFILVFSPGYSILKLLKYNDDPVSYTVLSLLTGMAVIPFIYSVTRVLDQSWLFILFGFICTIFFIVDNKEKFKPILRSIKNAHLEKIWWLGLLALCLMLFLLNFSHFGDLINIQEKGFLLRIHESTESIFHLGVINAVKTDIQPPYPYLSGYNLSYHLDMHLFAELLGRFTNISSLLITYYFLPLFYTILIVSVAAVFFYKQKASVAYSILFGFTIYAADISFLANFFITPPLSPYTEAGIALKAPMWSLFTLNGIMPAVPLLFGAIIMLDHSFKNEKLKYIALACLYTVASFRVKSSMAPHIIGALTATLVILHFTHQNRGYRKIWPALIATSLFIVLEHFSRVTPTESIRVIEFAPLNGLLMAFTRFNIDIPQSQDIGQQVLLAGLTFMAFVVYVIACFGVKIYFIKDIITAFKDRRPDPIIVFLLIFVVSGFMLTEVLFIGSKATGTNNSQWFSTQSLYASGFFVIYGLASISAAPRRALLTTLIITLLFTGTAYFLKTRNTNQFIVITPEQLALSNYMENNLDRNSVVMEPLAYRPSTASHLTGLNNVIALFMAFLGNTASSSVIDERGVDTRNFYFENNDEIKIDMIKKYNIDYVIFYKSQEKVIASETIGTKAYENDEYLLIEIKPTYPDKNRSVR